MNILQWVKLATRTTEVPILVQFETFFLYVSNAAQIVSNFDVIFVGDLFYDDVIGRKIVKLLEQVAQQKKIVLVGDPGQFINNKINWLAAAIII